MEGSTPPIKVTLLGTGSPPPVMDRFGPSTLVEVGGEKFLFDAGRGAMQRLFQLNVPFAAITGLFLTHLHSDHVVGFPDLWLTGWIGQPWGGRKVPLRVWGPQGTKEMMSHLEKAYEFDMRVRSHYPRQGAAILAEDFIEGLVYPVPQNAPRASAGMNVLNFPEGQRPKATDVSPWYGVYEKNGVRVTAFEVDHGRVKPAFGFRIDYAQRSVVLSGDTRFNQNVIRYSQGTDLLVHEVYAAPEELLRKSEVARIITGNHTTPEQAGEVFSLVKPRLAAYTHIGLAGGLAVGDLVAMTRKTYSGPLEVGEDLMSFEVGEKVQVRRFAE